MSGSSTSLGDYQPEDAKLRAEELSKDQPENAKSEDQGPRVPVDVSADYEASKAFSASTSDQSSGAGAATQNPSSEEATSEAKSTGNPDDYRSMAKDTNPNL